MMPAFKRALVTALTLAVAPVILAGEWHFGANAQCSDCHTQHNSANGLPMRTDNNPTPAPKLLLRDTPLNLCLSCHDGASPAAPDVVAPVSYVAESAAGSFADIGGTPVNPSSSYGHHLNTPSPVIPPGGTVPMILTCTTCHDPHGNNNYRNLRPNPSGAGAANVSVVVRQAVSANGSNPAQVYVASNIIYKSGISAWCGNCHGTSDPKTGHPIDLAIFGAAQANYTNWTSTTFPRVPVLSPIDNAIPSTDDQVVCVSCHKAHGSTNPSGMIYPDGATQDSLCQECHNQ